MGSDSLTYGTDYTAAAEFDDANAGTGKTVTVTVTLDDSVKNYELMRNTFTLTDQEIAKAAQTLTVPVDTYTKTYGDGEFSLDCSTNGDGKISYSSDNEKVVSVSDSGTVTVSGAGSAAITVTLADGANYAGTDSRTINITVDKANDPPNKPGNKMNVPNSCDKVGSAELPEGWEWKAEDKEKSLEVGTPLTATACYTKPDKDNYINIEVTVEITRSDCDHAQTEIVGAKEPTCTESGYTGDTVCTKCGVTVITGTEIAPTGHSGGTATCVKRAVCDKCHTEYGETNPKNHVNTALTRAVEATCAAVGYTGDFVCTDCDTVIKTGTEIAKLPHE